MTKKEFDLSDFGGMPFKTSMSTRLLVEWWEKEAKSEDSQSRTLAQHVLNQLKNAPEICDVVDDLSIFSKFPEETAMLFSGIFPAANWETELKSVVEPFGMEYAHATPKFKELAQLAHEQFEDCLPEEMVEIHHQKLLNSYLCILANFYDSDVEWETSMKIKIKDPRTDTHRYYNMLLDIQFTECKAVGEIPELSQQEIRQLLGRTDDIDFWMSKLPPELFEFEGFSIITPIDITESEVSSNIKQELLRKETLIEADAFASLQGKFRDVMSMSDLTVGIGAFSSTRDDFFFFGPEDQQIISKIQKHLGRDKFFELFDIDFDAPSPIIIEDVTNSILPKSLIEEFKKCNIRSIALMPLFMDGEQIGALQLGAPLAHKLNRLSLKNLLSLLPIIATAVQRSADEIENELQQIIKNRYTSLHKTVEWKFRQAAKNIRESKIQGNEDTIEDIVFDHVYPLYGAVDIRSSSIERNRAIQSDLKKQLSLAIKIMDRIIDQFRLPIYKELKYRLEKEHKRISKRLISQDEASIHEMFQKEVEPLFRHLRTEYPEFEKDMSVYFEAIDNKFEVLYEKRRDFEQSVGKINKAIYSLIESEEEKSQAMFPYYFENYKTDGVEYNIYLGQSLVDDRKFDPIYLRNLRLWQLLVMCKAANKAHMLVPELKVPLETTHLVLVQSTPLSIRFRTDEKKFDVDGAYNARYEIVKKRIDKAHIKGTDQRLTQTGRLAIVYSSNKEREEYTSYLNYLAHLGLIEREFENLDLEELQGVEGLKALRVKLKFSDDQDSFPTFGEEILSQFENQRMN